MPQVPAPAFDVTEDAAAAAAKVEPSAGGGAASEPAVEAPAAPAAPTISDVVRTNRIPGRGLPRSTRGGEDQGRRAETWTKLQKKHAQLLSGKELTVVEIDKGSDGKIYRVQAGPFADRAAATDACVALKKLEQGCMVVKP